MDTGIVSQVLTSRQTTHTKQTTKVLHTVDVSGKLAGQVASALVKLSVDVGPLGALEAIQ